MIKKYKIEIIIFLAAVILRLVFGFFAWQEQAFNSQEFFSTLAKDGYLDIAKNVINHRVFSYFTAEPFAPVSIRTPIYPIVIAAFLYLFNSLWPLLIFQILISGFLPILGRKISLAITPDTRIANLTALFLIVEPVAVRHSLMIMTETFFTLFFWLAIWLIIKFMNLKNPTARGNFRTMILAGFLLGAATLTKPVTLYFPVILIAAWLIYRFIIKQELLFKYVLAFLLVFGLTIAPWIVRNYQVFGSVSISSSQEGALFGYLAPSVYALKYHRDFPQAQAEFFASRGLAAYPEVNGANAPYFRKLALAEIKNYPKELIKISGISLFSFFTHDGMLAPLSQMGFLSPKGLTVGKIFKQSGSEFYKTVKDLFFSPAILILIVRVLWLIISVLFFMQAIYLFIKKKFTPASSLALICVLYFALTTIANGFGVNARFRLPAEVFIFIFAFSFVFDIINRRQDHAVL